MGKWSDKLLLPETTDQPKKERKWSDEILLPGIKEIESPIAGEEGKSRYLQTEYNELVGPVQVPPNYPYRTTYISPGDPHITPVPKGTVPAETKRASMGAHVAKGWVDKPETKIKILAEDMGIPEERFGVHNGEIVYLAEDGKLYYPTAQTFGGQLKRAAGESVASIPEVALGTAGSILGPKGTVAGTLAGTTIRKAVAKYVYGEEKPTLQHAKDYLISGGTAYLGHKAGDIGVGAIDRAKGSHGARLLRAAGRDRLRMNRKGVIELEKLAEEHGIKLFAPQATGSHELIARFNLLGDMPVTADKIGRARMMQYKQINDSINDYLRQFGPDTITKESSGKAAVKASEKGIKAATRARSKAGGKLYKKAFGDFKEPVTDTARLKTELKANKQKIEAGKPTAEPDVKAMVTELNKQMPGLPTMQIKGEPPKAYATRIAKDYKRITGKGIITKEGKGAADIEALKKRNAEIRDILIGNAPEGAYIPTVVKKVDASEAVKEIDELMKKTVPDDPSYKSLKRIKKMINDADGDPEKLDRVKRSGIDNVLRSDKVPTMTREMARVKNKLVTAMDEQVPGYNRARKTWGDESEVVGQISTKKGKIGKLAALEGDEIEKASSMVFSPNNSSPEIIAKVKPTIVKHGGQDAWDNMIKVYLKQKFRDVVKTNTTNIGGMFRKKIWTDLDQREIMQAAMSQEQKERLYNFMKVLDAVGKTAGKESTTGPRLVSIRDMEDAAQGLSGKVARAVAYPLYTWQRIIVDWKAKLRSEKYMNKLADAMISEKSVPQIKEMLQLKPGSQKLLKAFSVFLTTLTGANVQNITERAKAKDTLPPILKKPRLIQGGRRE